MTKNKERFILLCLTVTFGTYQMGYVLGKYCTFVF